MICWQKRENLILPSNQLSISDKTRLCFIESFMETASILESMEGGVRNAKQDESSITVY